MLEINRLDKIARRSKRVGGAIADLWGSHYVCPSKKSTLDKIHFKCSVVREQARSKIKRENRSRLASYIQIIKNIDATARMV